jgi:hypothetical protein
MIMMLWISLRLPSLGPALGYPPGDGRGLGRGHQDSRVPYPRVGGQRPAAERVRLWCGGVRLWRGGVRLWRGWMCPAVAALFCGMAGVSGVWAQEEAAAPVDFAREILPILSGKCFLCHGPDGESISDLRLDLPDQATADRGGYRAVDRQSPADSAVLLRIHSADDPMPPSDAEAQLSEQERQLLTRWIQQGGDYATHWAFVPPRHRPPNSAPEAQGAAAIDAYIQDQLQAQRWTGAPPAEPAVLARRVALVLTGLPPKVEWLQEYLADDDREAAYERLVDRLLNDRSFGQNQARFWLDAVRYGDTHGLHLDNRRGMYPYRDWVVKAFNDNLPWDQFIRWQVAGDLLPNPGLEPLVASGFVRLNPSTAEGGAIPEEFQAKNSFDRTESFGTIFLGLSLTCARCHTHKYDPITHEDYFRLLAYFNSTAEDPLDGNRYDYQPVIKAPASQGQWDAWQAWQQESQLLLAEAEPRIGGAQLAGPTTSSGAVPPEWAARWATAGDTQKLAWLGQELEPWLGVEIAARAQALREQRTSLEADWTTTLVAKELETRRATRILQRGEYDLPIGEDLAPAPLPVVGELGQDLPNNRLGLAQWLLHPDHPLLTRVLVNRFWIQVFGAGLVRTPEEFGLQGQQPTHPELLDFLALEFPAQGWDLKRFLKMLVMTKTFRQSAVWRSDVDDPENLRWARGPGYRLDAEVLRDLALLVSGLMVDEMGGEGFKPFQPPGMWEALAHPGSNTKTYQEDGPAQIYRRSLYLYWKRTSPHPTMTLFDAPSRETSCVQRSRSNTPLQSLALLNEPHRVHLGVATAQRLLTRYASDEERFEDLFRQLVSRSATEQELDVCRRLLADFRHRFNEFPADARSLLEGQQLAADVDADLAPAEVAAWCQVALTVLASDAVIMLY